jgi:putative DNA primase/helicase
MGVKPAITRYLERNEIGDAEMFVDLFSLDYLYDHHTDSWYKWEDHYWRGEGGKGALSAIDEVVKVYEKESLRDVPFLHDPLKRRINALNTHRRRVSVLKLAEAIFSREVDVRWDTHPWRMPCANGIIDLKTGELASGKQEDYQRAFCPTTYRGLQVTCPRWDNFMLEIMDGDEMMVGYLQRLVGYALSGTASEGVFPVLWGKGRNGKGTMLEVLGKVLGDFATPVSSSLLMEQTYSRNSSAASPDLMKLQGKRLVWANETDEGKKLSTALVKWLVGGDTITARPLYGMEISFRPTHTMFLLTNHKPEINAGDYALWQRLHLIPFKMSFVDNPTKPDEKRRDLDLMRRFTKIEDQGILTWAVKGCLNWQEYGLIPPLTVKAVTQEYVEEEDYIRDFLADETEPSEEEWTRAYDIYQRYRTWAYGRGLTVKSLNAFGRDLAGKLTKRRAARGNEYQIWLRKGALYAK